MPLSGPQFADLTAAVCGALDWAALEQLAQFRMSVRLADEVKGGPFKEVAFAWITWLEQRGRTADFVGFLFAERPGNELVRRFYEAYTRPPAAPPPAPTGGPPPPAPLPVPDDARESVVEFRTRFRESETQFGYLNALKDLHDTLHTLHDMQSGIETAVAQNRAKPGAGGLAVIADDLIALAVEANEAAKGLEFPEDAGWIGTFDTCSNRLKSAAPADVDEAVKALRELPDQHLAELDADLVRTLKRMKPTELAKTAADALAKLGAGGPAASPLLSEFRARLGGFSGLCAGLDGRMLQHTTCQRIEVILAPFAHAPDDLTAAKVPAWATAAADLDGLKGKRAGDKRAEITATAAAAFAAAAPPAAATAFATLVARFRRLFQDVDKELLAATDDLVHEARLLGVQMRALANVPD